MGQRAITALSQLARAGTWITGEGGLSDYQSVRGDIFQIGPGLLVSVIKREILVKMNL